MSSSSAFNSRPSRASTAFATVAVLATAGALAGEADVRDRGAVGDGETDDTAAFRKVLSDGGRLVRVPAGVYLIGPEPLDLAENLSLRGDGRATVLTAGREASRCAGGRPPGGHAGVQGAPVVTPLSRAHCASHVAWSEPPLIFSATVTVHLPFLAFTGQAMAKA